MTKSSNSHTKPNELRQEILTVKSINKRNRASPYTCINSQGCISILTRARLFVFLEVDLMISSSVSFCPSFTDGAPIIRSSIFGDCFGRSRCGRSPPPTFLFLFRITFTVLGRRSLTLLSTLRADKNLSSVQAVHSSDNCLFSWNYRTIERSTLMP